MCEDGEDGTGKTSARQTARDRCTKHGKLDDPVCPSWLCDSGEPLEFEMVLSLAIRVAGTQPTGRDPELTGALCLMR